MNDQTSRTDAISMCSGETLPDTAKCKNLTIRQQLELGVRFLDNRFTIHHDWVNQNLKFIEVIKPNPHFLEENSGDSIVKLQVPVGYVVPEHHGSLRQHQSKHWKFFLQKPERLFCCYRHALCGCYRR